MPVIITLIIAILLILISWTWHNLGSIDKNKKIVSIIAALIIIAIITLIIFNISKSGVNYKTEEEMASVRNVLVVLFTLINGLVIMPSLAKTIGKVYAKEIDKDKASKRILIAVIIFIVVLVIECGYLKNVQNGILDIYHSAAKK